MFKKIFVPLDGSQLAESVLPVVSYMAEKFSAGVHLFHVIEDHPPRTVHRQPHIGNEAQAADYLGGISSRLEEKNIRTGFHVHSEGLEGVAKSITAHIEEQGSDLIIMCSHGRNGVKKLLFGSIAQQVLKAARIPLLMVPPIAGSSCQEFSCQRIEVPLDDDPAHLQRLSMVGQFAEQCGSKVFLLQVIPRLSSIPGKWRVSGKLLPATAHEMLNIASSEAEKHLRELADRYLPDDIAREIAVFRGNPVEVVPKIARDNDIDLLLLNTHAKYGLEAIWSGSFAAQVCRGCPVSILFLVAEGE